MNESEILEQCAVIERRFKERESVYTEIGAVLEPMSHIFAWRHSAQLIKLMTQAVIGATAPTSAGPTIEEWRRTSDKHILVTRYISNELATAREPLTLKKLYTRLGTQASPSTIKATVREGLDLNLLRRVPGGYVPTDLYYDESFSRAIVKIMNPWIVNFCRWVVAFHDQRDANLQLLALEKKGAYVGDKRKTIQETLFYTE